MTWLSRLLPQSPRLPRLADHNHRTRQGQRRRRMSTLEALEDRTLLAGNVVTSIVPAPTGGGARQLDILGAPTGVTFTVTENPTTGQVTVSPGSATTWSTAPTCRTRPARRSLTSTSTSGQRSLHRQCHHQPNRPGRPWDGPERHRRCTRLQHDSSSH